MKAIGDPFDDFDLVVDAFQFAGVYLMLAVADDPRIPRIYACGVVNLECELP